MKNLTLEINSNLGDVSLAAVSVHAICLYAGLSQERASLIELSIVEALTNTIQHAYHGESGHTVALGICVTDENLCFDLYDTGTHMPEEQVDRLIRGNGDVDSEHVDPTVIPENGRGLAIIHGTMDAIAYTRGSEHNHLMLTIRLNQTSSGHGP